MDHISFSINGEPHSVGSETSSDEMLLDYLRSRSELRGTKYMCREGGCGACVVAAARPGQPPMAVNSCLVSVTSCQDWEITTVEGVGNRKQGYHRLQKTLAAHHGTQCGHCTPGWIMAMYRYNYCLYLWTYYDVPRDGIVPKDINQYKPRGHI